MKFLVLPEGRHRLPFYLAAEEYAARSLSPEDDYFFTWIVEPTVIIGRNQLLDTEVNVDYCRAHDIDICRRKSGGGVIYSDLRNIMMSYVTSSGNTTETFAAYTEKVAAMLRSLGIDAEAGSRNDVTIGPDRRKVSGNAFYRMGSRSIAHGTMLFGVDRERMAAAINPSKLKLQSKGVQSVRSLVTCVSRYCPEMSIDEFLHAIRSYMTDGEIAMTPDYIAGIEQIEAGYYTDDWLIGHNPRGAAAFCKRIEGVGDFNVSIVTRSGHIESVDLKGDFFLLADLDSALLDHLRGVDFNRESVNAALLRDGIDPAHVIYGLTHDEFLNLLF